MANQGIENPNLPFDIGTIGEETEDDLLCAEPDEELDEEMDATKTAWENLFLVVLSATEEDAAPDETAFEDFFDALEDADPYKLRVHGPFINDSNEPIVINLDVYKGDLHIQRAAAMATWTDGAPEVTDINNDSIELAHKWFSLLELAQHAAMIVSTKGIAMDKSTGLPKNAIFPIPDVYLDTVH